MNGIKCIFGQYTCNSCSKNESFSEIINTCSVKRFECTDFTIIFIKVFDTNIFKLKLTIVCKNCFQVKNCELNIGKFFPQNFFKTDDTYTHICCNKHVDITSFLSEDFINENDRRHYNEQINFNSMINSNLNIINDNNDDNINNNNEINDNSIKNEIEQYNSMNIIEFNKKNKVVNFLDEKTNKRYKIYTKSDVKVKNIMEDLISQFPEINYKNQKLTLNNLDINPEVAISVCNLNDNSTIIIKK